MQLITRRRWFVEAASLASLPGALWALEPDEEMIDFADTGGFAVESRPANPRMKNSDWRQLAEPITPNDEFFVFHQTTVPAIDLAQWRLEIAGAVERPQSFTLAELARRPAQEVEFTLECSGNLPRPEIMNGQIGNARWSGLNLAALLRHCGVRPEAREVVFFGADRMSDPSGQIVRQHGRSIFIQDALSPEAILAATMNGVPLPAEHGFPLRLILPGWYGMAQIKWLSRIEVLDRRYEGVHMSRNYQSVRNLPASGADQLVIETSISQTRLKSVVARVTRRRKGSARDFRVTGAAWGGPAKIARVEVRIDDGPWRETRIEYRGGPHAWLLWSFAWSGATSGSHRIVSRAIDREGRIQPTVAERRAEIRSAREDNSQWERAIELPG